MGGGPTPLGSDHHSCLHPEAKQQSVLEWGPAPSPAWHGGCPCHSPLNEWRLLAVHLTWRELQTMHWWDGAYLPPLRRAQGGTWGHHRPSDRTWPPTDRSQSGHARLTRVNRAAPHVRPHCIKCGEGRLGRCALMVVQLRSPPHSLPPPRGGWARQHEGPRGLTWHPEAPWLPLHRPRCGGRARLYGRVAGREGDFPTLRIPPGPYHRQ